MCRVRRGGGGLLVWIVRTALVEAGEAPVEAVVVPALLPVSVVCHVKEVSPRAVPPVRPPRHWTDVGSQAGALGQVR